MMNSAYRDALAAHGGSLVRYIGLVDKSGNELSGTGYARLEVSWETPKDGTVRPTKDLIFTVPAGVTVAGWRGYGAAAGGTEYGGGDVAAESFSGAGECRLIAKSTGIVHKAAN